MDRRRLLTLAGSGVLATAFGGKGVRAIEHFVDLPFANGERPLVAYPQKRPLIRLTARPPQLETPFEVFDEGAITANDAFFVRYHLGAIPLTIDPATYRIEVGGLVERPLSLSLSDLRPGLRPRRSSPSISVRETAAGSSNPALEAGNSPTAQWETRNGVECLSRPSWTRPDSKPMQSR